MSETMELLEAQKNAVELESMRWWKSLMPYLTVVGVLYNHGEPRRYYKGKNGRYYYRKITESEIYRRC